MHSFISASIDTSSINSFRSKVADYKYVTFALLRASFSYQEWDSVFYKHIC